MSTASKREILAWAFYDFANSGYTTVVLTTIYSAYFVGVVAADVDLQSPGRATLLWTLAIAAANLVVLLSGPVIGAIADVRASKKPFLLASSIMCVTCTALLAFAAPGQVWFALFALTLSAIAFAYGENLIAAFLPEIASHENMGRISGYGWSLGYFGGLLTLGTIVVQGMVGLYCLVGISACMSLMFPTIYGLALKGVGEDAKLGSAGLIFAIVGGVFMTRFQGQILDLESFMGTTSTRGSFFLVVLCFIIIAIYGFTSSRYTKRTA